MLDLLSGFNVAGWIISHTVAIGIFLGLMLLIQIRSDRRDTYRIYGKHCPNIKKMIPKFRSSLWVTVKNHWVVAPVVYVGGYFLNEQGWKYTIYQYFMG